MAIETQERFGKTFLILLAVGISLVFFFMVRRFVVAVFWVLSRPCRGRSRDDREDWDKRPPFCPLAGGFRPHRV